MANDIDPTVSAMARALSMRGASKGGLARAASLSRARRVEIATKASKAATKARKIKALQHSKDKA